MSDVRDAPEWRAAQAEYVREAGDDEDPDSAYVRQIRAAAAMWLLEKGAPVSEAMRFLPSDPGPA